MYTIERDKANHFIAGVLLFAVGHFASPVIGLGMAFAYAIGKEIWDSMGHGTPDVWDAVWTVAGGVVGLICYL